MLGGSPPPTHRDKYRRGHKQVKSTTLWGGNKIPCPSPGPYTKQIMQERALRMKIKDNAAPPTTTPTHKQKTDCKEHIRVH